MSLHGSLWGGLLYLVALNAHAQPLLEGLGGGVGQQGVNRMITSADGTELLVAGAFAYAGGVQVSPGILRWSDGVFTSVGCGVAWDCSSYINQGGIPPTFGLAEWNGSLYIGGEWTFPRDGEEFNYIMRWDGEEWHTMGSGVDNKVTSIRVIDDQLIVTGWFQYADTVLANGLARWDGERWHRVVDVPQFSQGDNNYINDVAFYEGLWYLGGNLLNVGDLVRWTGTAWEPVGGGLYGAFGSVQKLHIHDDRLYVSGTFSACPPYGVPTNPGSGIVAWDGENWDDLGGGTCGASLPDVFGTTWWNDELYVSGRFDRIGGVLGGQLAKWDGEQWCMLLPPGFFSGGGANALAIYNDSLYIGGAFTEEGSPPISCFAKWVGADQTFGCGTYVGMAEAGTTFGDRGLYPNPARDLVYMRNAPVGMVSIAIRDAFGRVVYTAAASENFNVSALSSGTYVVLALSAAGEVLDRTMLIVQ